MSRHLEHSISRRWIPALATLAIMGLLVVLIVMVDGRIAAWSQHLAQNAANAAALAGARSLHEIMHSSAFVCNETPESLITAQIQLYADLNHASDTDSRLSAQGYYLTQAAAGDYQILLNPETGQRWTVSATGSVPCAAIRGLRVEVYYPQETLLTRLFALEHARVVVEAAAASQHSQPWEISLVEHRSITGDVSAIIRNTNESSGLDLQTNGTIRAYLTGNAIIEETLLGKRAVVSRTVGLARPWLAAAPLAGTKVGLPKAEERVIQSVSELSGSGL